MSPLTLRKATREKTKMRVALAGPSGSGKTYSALLLASGMADWDKIALIDTENGSGDLYAHLGGYSVITLTAPFTPERYVEAIDACEKAGMEVIIIDSMSHEWEGKGGILETHDSMTGNSYTNWALITPRHNAFINKILQSSCHVIATLRAKQDYVLVEKKGKQVPEKVGMKAITREGVDYEFTLVFDLNINHLATASKDRTGIFMSAAKDVVVPEKISRDTGVKLLDWTRQGKDSKPPASGKAPPTLKSVLEALTGAETEKQLVQLYERSFAYAWKPEEISDINHVLKARLLRFGYKVNENGEVFNPDGELVELKADAKGMLTLNPTAV